MGFRNINLSFFPGVFMCSRHFLFLLEHCQHKWEYTIKKTPKKMGGHQSPKIFLLLLHLQILRSRFNLEDLSRTMFSCYFSFCFVFSVHKSKTFWNCIEAGVHRCILGSPPPPLRISSTSASTNIGSLTALAWIHMHLK